MEDVLNQFLQMSVCTGSNHNKVTLLGTTKFPGCCLSSGILNQHTVLETGYVLILRQKGEEARTQVDPLERLFSINK
jgi:hypothetical protein